MKKILSIFLSITLMLVMTSTASAKESKADAQQSDFFYVDGGSSDYPLLDQPYKGHSTVVDPMGNNDVILHGVIDGLLSNTTYYVWVRQLNGYIGDYLNSAPYYNYFELTSFATNEYGHGTFNYHINDSYLPDGTYNIQVAINFSNSVNEVGYTVAATDKYLTVTVKQ